MNSTVADTLGSGPLRRMTLGQIVTANPRAAESFVRFGLDSCCRGQRPLLDACNEAGVDVEAVLADLDSAGAEQPAKGSWADRSPTEPIDHILEQYHEPLRRDLPTLIVLARKVEQIHADKPSRPAGLTQHLERVQAAVEDHLAKEEQILFPLIRAGRGNTAYMPIKVMMAEHEDHGESLRRTRVGRRGSRRAHRNGSWFDTR